MVLTKVLPSYRRATCGGQHNLLPMPLSRQPVRERAIELLSTRVLLLQCCFRHSSKTSGHQSALILRKPQRRVAESVAASHLSKVPDVKKVEGLKQLAFPHAKHLGARHQEGPDVLQAQKLLGR